MNLRGLIVDVLILALLALALFLGGQSISVRRCRNELNEGVMK